MTHGEIYSDSRIVQAGTGAFPNRPKSVGFCEKNLLRCLRLGSQYRHGLPTTRRISSSKVTGGRRMNCDDRPLDDRNDRLADLAIYLGGDLEFSPRVDFRRANVRVA